MTQVVAWIGLGANLGDPAQQLATALRALDQLPQSRVQAWSSLYRSAAVGGPQQPDYLNAVVRLQTSLAAPRLLQALLQIEQAAGRRRDGVVNAPRTLDLDLLDYDQQRIEQPGLCLPHPRLHLRAFVLLPLIELGAELQVAGAALHSWLKQLSSQRVLRLPTPAVWTL